MNSAATTTASNSVGADDEDADLQRALAMSLEAASATTAAAAATTTTTTNSTAASTSSNRDSVHAMDVDMDSDMEFDMNDEDAQLAAALRMSLENNLQATSETKEILKDSTESAVAPTEPPSPIHLPLDGAEPTPILDVHYILWEPGTTTRNDQLRWFQQPIQFKNKFSATPDFAKDSLLSAIIANPALWGLTQTHGGPCGVLASIQAELMRMLLFGPRTTDDTKPSIPYTLPLHIPTQLTNHFCQAKPDLSTTFLQQTLALSMGIILARAALQPSATLNDKGGETAEPSQVSSNAPQSTPSTTAPESTTSGPSSSGNSHNGNEQSVKLVFPRTDKFPEGARDMDWNHFGPWDAADGSALSEFLCTYTLSIHVQSTTSATTTPTSPTRTKKASTKTSPSSWKHLLRSARDAFAHTSTSNNASQQTPKESQKKVRAIEDQEERLAQVVAEFLLETGAIQWYQKQGGVLLFLFALALSRGVANLQADMDDPTARLTSQFGHCSQELINLLLTGQGVSNVFDNTLRPSGELICRGIQSRPVIGYLSQLESMRYLEVGGYYKTPQFPIWVVGSTSHFTVLFGDANCLKESKSDILLERVRRAFKAMDGGEENGFIRTGQLKDFLQRIDLLDKIGPHGVATLSATMEVPGADIILWEELWKRVSRLMTGASLEAILEWDGSPLPKGNRSNPQASSTTSSTPSQPISDEDYARRLHAEWNGQNPQSAAPTVPTETPQSTKQPGMETFGQTFQLYHYNGLRGGFMKPFRVTRLTADEAIGASVSLGTSSNSTGGGGGLAMPSEGGLEDVLRTKWPSCKINWLNTGPPSID